MKNSPLLIVMTPVRNEAWVLNVFLKATSLWADYIIIADQMSTDGSRDIAKSFDKVILIDNNNDDFNESERQSLLINRAREIQGDKILFGLDADEILAANFKETEDWQKILNSKPGDVFWFKWAEIMPSQKEYTLSGSFPWMFHDDGVEPHGNYVRNIHSMRIPYPLDEKQMYYVEDFRVLHLAHLNRLRDASKSRFYYFIDWEMNSRSMISLSRHYRGASNKKPSVLPLEPTMIYQEPEYDFNLFSEVDCNSSKFYFDQYIVDRLPKYDISKIRQLDIWDDDLLLDYNLKDPRNLGDKIVHLYLRSTKKIAKSLFIRAIDKLLKLVIR